MEAKQRENLIKKCEEIYTKAMESNQLVTALEAVRLQLSIARDPSDTGLGSTVRTSVQSK